MFVVIFSRCLPEQRYSSRTASQTECLITLLLRYGAGHSTKEKNLKSPGCVSIVDGKNIRLEGSDGSAHQFGFDYVYGDNTKQEQVFGDLGVPILDAALGGFNGTIFAYGQTGSGKTWSMTGIPEQEGIIPRLNKETIRAHQGRDGKKGKTIFSEASYFEIYNEIIYDLLDPTRKPGQKSKENSLQIKESKALGIYVKGLKYIVVDSMDKVQQLMDQGQNANSVRDENERTKFSLAQYFCFEKSNKRTSRIPIVSFLPH